jgi:hypothetical protein
MFGKNLGGLKMRKAITLSFLIALVFILSSALIWAAGKSKIILLISEQNISGPKSAWWASEVDLSATEAIIANKLIQSGFEIVEPQKLEGVIKKERAFRRIDLAEKDSIKLANLGKAEYLLLGKAVASAGGRVPQSNMYSCFANLTAKLVRVKDGKVLAYLEAAGSSAHLDVISGGREALVKASRDLAPKIIAALNN